LVDRQDRSLAGRNAEMATRDALLVENDRDSRDLIEQILRDSSFRVQVATTEHDALASCERGTDLVIVGDPLADSNGAGIVRRLRGIDPFCPIMLVVGDARVEHAVEALRLGATDYASKPIDPSTIDRFLQQVVANEPHTPSTRAVDEIVGSCAAIRRLRASLKRVARRPRAPVLLTGETGTGKSLAARALHAEDPIATGPLSTLACRTSPPETLDSELFGRPGAPGLLQRARGGTLLIEDIDWLPPRQQVELIGALDSGTFHCASRGVEVPLDLRIVASTQSDLRESVRHERFRADLYYRLAVFTADLPPLRDRPGDIELLVRRFIVEICHRELRPPLLLTEQAVSRLCSHPWPGNVRELRSLTERAVLSTQGARLESESLDLPTTSPSRSARGLDLPSNGVDLRELERRLVEQALHRAEGNLTRAAGLLGLNRDQMRYRVVKYGLKS
jgi:DNA-binding NtrC family response regulator